MAAIKQGPHFFHHLRIGPGLLKRAEQGFRLQKPLLIGIDNAEGRIQIQQVKMLGQDSFAEGMEGADPGGVKKQGLSAQMFGPCSLIGAAKGSGDSVVHFFGGRIGIGQHQNPIDIDEMFRIVNPLEAAEPAQLSCRRPPMR